jgi:hypothetical protein
MQLTPSPDVKMMFPVRRKPSTSRAEFIAYWFAHHMPVTIAAMAGRGRGYIGTVLQAAQESGHEWDGMAQMFLAEPLRNPRKGFAAKPVDSFHERIEPYFGWATREYMVLAGADDLPLQPLTLSIPSPTSRSGFFKVVSLRPNATDADHESLQSFWLHERAPKIADAMREAKGFRYVIGLSLEPETSPYAGMEELYFHDEAAWQHFQELVKADDSVGWALDEDSYLYYADTEFVGIPA